MPFSYALLAGTQTVEVQFDANAAAQFCAAARVPPNAKTDTKEERKEFVHQCRLVCFFVHVVHLGRHVSVDVILGCVQGDWGSLHQAIDESDNQLAHNALDVMLRTTKLSFADGNNKTVLHVAGCPCGEHFIQGQKKADVRFVQS